MGGSLPIAQRPRLTLKVGSALWVCNRDYSRGSSDSHHSYGGSVLFIKPCRIHSIYLLSISNNISIDNTIYSYPNRIC
jgi:hypothetical protein